VTRASLGTYPELSLAAARDKAIDMRRSVVHGLNPVEEKRRERREAQEKAFPALAERYLEKHARRFKKSHAADERNLRLHVLPFGAIAASMQSAAPMSSSFARG
jgi:hypothetical protein